MKWLYNSIYLTLFFLLAPWVVWRVVVQKKNRRGWNEKLFGLVPELDAGQNRVWIHAVSVGEINLLSPLVSEFQSRWPESEVVISTTTESGYDLAKRKFPDLNIFFCPADFSWAVEKAFARIKPELFLLTELELWPNLIAAARKQGASVVLFNGRIGRKSYLGYRTFRFWMRQIFDQIDLALVQCDTYRRRLIELGIHQNRVFTTGNIKFDCTAELTDHRGGEFAELAGIQEDQCVLLAGSTQENEDRIIIDAFKIARKTNPALRLILAPRHPARCNKLATILQQNQLDYVLRSELKPGIRDLDNPPVLVIDVIGELRAWWTIANVAYVGGSFGRRGGQNMIEPALVGLPICFGPDTHNFKDVVNMLLAKDAALVVHNVEEIVEFLEWVASDHQAAEQMGQRAKEIAVSQQGAAKRSIDLIESQRLNSSETRPNSSEIAA